MADVVIDEKKVEKLKRWIIVKENANIKTHEKGDSEMVKLIKKHLEEVVNAPSIN